MLRDIRNTYQRNKLEENQLTNKPMGLFQSWLKAAIGEKVNEPTAMVLSTAVNNQPDTRVVLLKEIQDEGLIFYTNYESNKGNQIEQNNSVAVNLFWQELERQVRIKGSIQKIDEITSIEYFRSRPRDSQLGALSSKQSQVVESRNKLESDYKELERKYEGKEIPKPENWGGYLIRPHEIEFWQGRPRRLHDRIRFYKQTNGKWEFKRLSP